MHELDSPHARMDCTKDTARLQEAHGSIKNLIVLVGELLGSLPRSFRFICSRNPVNPGHKNHCRAHWNKIATNGKPSLGKTAKSSLTSSKRWTVSLSYRLLTYFCKLR